ncbi:MAG: hypothetical protein ABWY00_15985, partial [Dongiaceae bacterium]
MATAKRKSKASPRKGAARPGTSGKRKSGKGRGSARQAGFSWASAAQRFSRLRPRLLAWLDHAGGRFSMGIGIGLLVGLIAILSFNHLGGWLDRQRIPARPG